MAMITRWVSMKDIVHSSRGAGGKVPWGPGLSSGFSGMLPPSRLAPPSPRERRRRARAVGADHDGPLGWRRIGGIRACRSQKDACSAGCGHSARLSRQLPPDALWSHTPALSSAHRIVPAGMERMALEQAPACKQEPPPSPVARHRLTGVLRAGGGKPAVRREQGRDHHLIDTDEDKQESAHGSRVSQLCEPSAATDKKRPSAPPGRRPVRAAWRGPARRPPGTRPATGQRTPAGRQTRYPGLQRCRYR